MLMPSRFTAWGHALTLLLSQTLFILGMRALPPSILTPYKEGVFFCHLSQSSEGSGASRMAGVKS